MEGMAYIIHTKIIMVINTLRNIITTLTIQIRMGTIIIPTPKNMWNRMNAWVLDIRGQDHQAVRLKEGVGPVERAITETWGFQDMKLFSLGIAYPPQIFA